MKREEINIGCVECNASDEKKWTFDQTGTNIAIDEKKHLIHVHFGHPTLNEEESTGQAAFVYEHIIGQLYQQHPKDLFFVIADFSRLDDSTAPSAEALRLYAKIIRDEQTAMVLCHDVRPGMRGIIQVLSHTPKIKKKIDIVGSLQEACDRYEQWGKGDVSMRKIK